MSIVWNQQRMTTGVEEIDRQHQELIGHYNAFQDALAHGKGQEVCIRTLAFVADYAEWHFKNEEECMRQFRCPAAGANLAAHNGLRMELIKVRSRIKNDQMKTEDMLKLSQILSDWIQNHICSVDVKLRECVGAGACAKA